MRMLILSEFVADSQALSSYLAGVAPGMRLHTAPGIDEFSSRYPGILPDLILAVIRWDPADGTRLFDGLDRIGHLYPQSPVIAYTDVPLYLTKKIIRKGAMGYLTHNASLDDLAACIAAVAAGRKFMETGIISSLLGNINPEDHPAVQAKFMTLSPREQQIAKMLVSHRPIKEIASQLQVHNGSVQSIKKRIFSKLNIANISMLAQILRLAGLAET